MAANHHDASSPRPCGGVTCGSTLSQTGPGWSHLGEQRVDGGAAAHGGLVDVLVGRGRRRGGPRRRRTPGFPSWAYQRVSSTPGQSSNRGAAPSIRAMQSASARPPGAPRRCRPTVALQHVDRRPRRRRRRRPRRSCRSGGRAPLEVLLRLKRRSTENQAEPGTTLKFAPLPGVRRRRASSRAHRRSTGRRAPLGSSCASAAAARRPGSCARTRSRRDAPGRRGPPGPVRRRAG